MSALEKIAFYRKRRDEVPNQELAAELVKKKDKKGVAEIAAHLWDRNQNVRSDCLKVLYETGYLEPGLIAPHTGDFLKLLDDRENRMVWGAMIALALVADRKPKEIAARADPIMTAVESGTVITMVWGIRVLANASSKNAALKRKAFPFLLGMLGKCIPRDVPTHAESMLPMVGPRDRKPLLAILRKREPEMTAAQKTRLKKVRRALEEPA
jgi:hypothetical protein